MRVQKGLGSDGKSTTTYDEIYLNSWQEAMRECDKTLERQDRDRALQVKSLEDFQGQLEILLTENPDDRSTKAIMLLYPTLGHYGTFAENFVNMMTNPVDTSMMWGLLFLIFKIAIGSTDPGDSAHGDSLARISKWLERIGHRLRASNDCKHCIMDLGKVMGDTVQVNREIVILWLNIIMTFRNEGRGDQASLDETAWESLTAVYNAAYETIEEAVKRIEKVAEMAERQARAMNDMILYQRLLSLEKTKQEGASLPCNTLPVAQNHRFFGRHEVLEALENHLTPADIQSHLTSIALYGLGGIGKTQTALAYAYQQLGDLDAVFWVPAEDAFSIQQGFSRMAIDALKLPKAQPQAYQENMILALDWLQKTNAKWLLIFDNVDRHDVLDNCWPASKHGAVLVTTRDVLVASLPIDKGIEVNEFETTEGAEFLLEMSTNRRRVDNEVDEAVRVASILGGLPLALNQMAALINARNWSIRDFYNMYLKHEQRLHNQKKSGWKYLGYQHALDTVWEISFTTLGSEARACLGVLSFLSADSVPSEVFTPAEYGELPELLAFCENELSLGDSLEELTHHALVRKNIEEGSFRIHRLVQAEYRARMENPQEHFEAATRLLLSKFPTERSNKYDDSEWALYEQYIPQVLSLVKNYNESLLKPQPLRANKDFISLLVNAANAIHDNDTMNVVGSMLDTADSAYQRCPEAEQDRLLWAFLQSLKCMYHFCTSEFQRSEREMSEGLAIRLEMLPPNDLLVALAYSWLAMAFGGQGGYEEGLSLLLKAGTILEGPAGDVPTRKLIWGYNTARNYYCMGKFDEAEKLLSEALADAERSEGWYMQVYGHLTFVSLRTRMGKLDEAKRHVDVAKEILETSGIAARFSWLSSYCAYRAGDVAMKQGRYEDAIEETEKSMAIGKLVKVPIGILCRCIHAYSTALKLDPARQEEAELQRKEARQLRARIPGGGGNLDDESDEAFERLVKMDHR